MSNKLIPIAEKVSRYSISATGCWEYTGTRDRDGYGVFTHTRNKQVRAHRAAFEFHVGQITDGQMVCHSCDNPSCINPDHLFLGSAFENTKDMIGKGRKTSLCGERHPLAKLTESDVCEIRELRSDGHSLKAIAFKFGITFQTVSEIHHHKTWKTTGEANATTV